MAVARENTAVYAVLAERTLIERALERLADMGLKVGKVEHQPKGYGGRVDAIARIGRGKTLTDYGILAKRQITPANFGAVLVQLEAYPGRKLLIAEYVTPPLAARLRELGVAFVDVLGNAYLESPPILIWVVGNKPLPRPKTARPARVFQPGGLKTVFALLCLPELTAAPLRKLATAANVALGTAAWVMEDLRTMGHVRERGKRGRILVNRAKLLDLWAGAYPHLLKPKLKPQHFLAPDPGWWKRLDLDAIGTLLGGEPAAAALTGHLKPEITTLYLKWGLAPLVNAQILLPPNERPNVEVMPVFWNFDFPWEHRTLAPPLLIYADLLATGDDRCIETAQLIHEAHLARLARED